jgi:hypothetical protein
MQKVLASVFLTVMCAALLTRPAYAYLDPGAASLLLQGLIGGIAAASAVISLNYHRFKGMLTAWKNKGSGRDGQ